MSQASVLLWALLGGFMLMAGTVLMSSPVPGVPGMVPLLLVGGGAGAIVGSFIAAVLR